MIELGSTDRDAPEFVNIVGRLLNATIAGFQPRDIHIVQIDHAFDFKWNSFSGVIFPQVGSWMGPLLRVPPFHPNRVMRETHFILNESGKSEYKVEDFKHIHVRQFGHRNFQRRLSYISDSGLYVWYSGETGGGNRASVMIYEISKKANHAFYISFVNMNGWKINKTRDISRQEVLRLISEGTAIET